MTIKTFILFLCIFALFSCGNLFAKAPEKIDIDKILKSGKPVIVKLGNDLCTPCAEMKPILSDLSKEFKNKIIILDIDIKIHREFINKYKVNLIPTVIFYDKKGKQIDKYVGFMSREQIINKINKLGLIN